MRNHQDTMRPSATASKLPRPALAGVIRRVALEERLDEAFGKRLTVVVGGAGFGKTTLLASWTRDLASVWYTLGRQDRELSAFGLRLIDALGAEIGPLPAEIATALRTEEPVRADAFAALLCESVEQMLAHDLVLVFDDLHELGDASDCCRVIDALSRQGPETLHVVLLSRAEPPFPIARLKGQGQVLELDASELSFTEDETRMLLTSTLGTEAGELAIGLQRASGGWPAAVRLALEALGRIPSGERADTLERLSRPAGPLFEYLAEEVFGREPERVRELIRTVAPFDHFHQDLCSALGLEQPADTLAQLVRRGLLVREQSGADGWFELHALVREFARQRWPLSEPAQRSLHRRAAEWYQANGSLPDALHALTVAGDPAAISAFLRRHEDELLPASAQLVIEAALVLTHQARDSELERFVGEAHYAAGDVEAARNCFDRAAGDSQELDPRLARCLGLTHYPHGDLDEAMRSFARARLGAENTADTALLLALWSNAHSLRGNVEKAHQFATRALTAAQASGDARALTHARHALGLAAQLAGDRRGAREHYLRGLREAERVNEVLQIARARNNLAADQIACGECSDALAQLQIALPLAELHSLNDLVPLILLNRSDALRHLGRLDEALADLEAADRVFKRRGESAVGCLCGLADVYRDRGDLALARAAYESTVAIAEQTGNVERLRPALSGLALTLVDEDPDRAKRLAERALETGRGAFDGEALLTCGWIALARGEREEAAKAASEAAVVGRALEGRAVLAESLDLRALSGSEPARSTAHLEEAISIWRDLQNPFRAARAELARARLAGDPNAAERAERRLRAAGVRVSGASRTAGLLASLPPPRSQPIQVQTLGGFQLLREAKPVPLSEWQSKKARDLVKLLVCRRGRPTPREVLMEALWPGEEPARLSNRLSVALSTVRSVLDPDHQLPPDYYLQADQSAATLTNLSVDVDAFLTEAEAGLAGDPERLEEAEALYAGDFLEEDAYEEWAVPLREEARATYIRVARALADHSVENGRPEAAARYLRRILERDPHDEHAHLALVERLSAAGQHGEARRAYRAYTARMDEIGIEAVAFPAPARARFEFQSQLPPTSASTET